MKVKDILSGRSVISVREDDELGIAMQIMLWARVHHLPVLSGNDKLVGLLDERDILTHHTKAGCEVDHDSVRAAMSLTVATVTPDEEISEAALRMIGRGVSCLVVLDGVRLVGMLTTTDLIQHLAAPQLAAVPDQAATQ